MPRKGAHELIRPNEWGAKTYHFRLAGIQQTAVGKNPIVPGRDPAIFGAGGRAGARTGEIVEAVSSERGHDETSVGSIAAIASGVQTPAPDA